MKKIINSLIIVALLVSSQIFAATRPTTKVTVKAGKITGEVFNSIGKRVSEIEITVFNKENQELIAELSTDDSGHYTIDNLESGHYELKIGDVMSYEMRVFEKIGISSLKIVLPEGYAAGFMDQIPLAEWAGGFFGTSTELGGVVVFGAAAVAGTGIGLGIDSSGGDSSNTVSPP